MTEVRITPGMTVTEGTAHDRPVEPCTIVIFGASGDLTQRLLIPSLYNLACNNLLPSDFAVVGAARRELSHDAFRAAMRTAIHESTRVGTIDPAVWDALEQRLYYVQLNVDDAATYARLSALLGQCDRDHRTQGNYLYYLATPPTVFSVVAEQLGHADLAWERAEAGRGWRRLIIEKPFGRDLASAQALSRTLQAHFSESQLYRIDHYLGKETVQNVLVFRFANGMLEPIWNQRYIDHVQITVAETVGVEQRGDYYEQAGLLRDMVQNHLFQLLALVAMEPPYSFEADAVRDEKAKVMHALHLMRPDEVGTCAVRGQYGEGRLNGQRVAAYRQEPKVSPTSNTETYGAFKLHIDNWRWAGVPFYLRSGKALPKRWTEIVIQFRQAPHLLFGKSAAASCHPNRLILHIQPQEGISWQFEAKVPGPRGRIKTVSMDFHYDDFFGAEPSTGYETLLYDAMMGDATLFQRRDFVEAAWTAVMPILDVWQNVPARDFPNYPARHAWGPAEADALIQRDGRSWRQLSFDET